MLRSDILDEVGVPSQYFGIIFAVFGIISGIAAKNQGRIHEAFHNKTLMRLSIPVGISYILMGFFTKWNGNFSLTIIALLALFLIQYIAKGPFSTLIRQYMNNFTNTNARAKISSSFNLLESVFRALFYFLASFLLRCTTTDNVSIILGCIFSIILVLLLDNMKDKVGLKPEEYREKDMNLLEIK